MTLPFNKNYKGRFTIAKEARSFWSDQNRCTNSFVNLVVFLKPINFGASAKIQNNVKEKTEASSNLIWLETWKIWIDVAKKWKIDPNVLANSYKDTIWNIISKWKELPITSYIKTIGNRLKDYEYDFEYDIKIINKHDRNKANYFADYQKPKKIIHEFEIEWGRIICEVESMSKQQLDEVFLSISPLLIKSTTDFSSVDYANPFDHTFDGTENSEDIFIDDSSFIFVSKEEKKVDSNRFVSKNIADENDSRVKHKIVETKKMPDDHEDDYQFTHEQLFGKKNLDNKNKTLAANIRNDIQRNRWNSDNSAWTRFKNILGDMNSKQEINPF